MVPVKSTYVVDKLRAAGCVFAEDEAKLLIAAAVGRHELAAMVEQRVAGRPLEHVLGWAEFCGLRIAVEPGVFVPRRRTEFLVREAAALARPGAIAVDLCCGSGAVGAALLASVERIEIHAVDIDGAAVHCAERNLVARGGRVYQGDLYEPLPASLRGRVDLVVANVPYVPTQAIAFMPAEARLHEPRWALDGGGDGLDVFRRVVAEAARWLAPGGHVLIETSEEQATLTLDIAAKAGLTPRLVTSDDADANVLVATVANHSFRSLSVS